MFTPLDPVFNSATDRECVECRFPLMDEEDGEDVYEPGPLCGSCEAGETFLFNQAENLREETELS